MTMEKFKPGQRAEMEVEITKDLTTNRMGREGADVLSTPALLGLMENASIKVTEPNLPEGHTTVGYAVDGLRHLVATPLGGTVVVKTELTEVLHWALVAIGTAMAAGMVGIAIYGYRNRIRLPGPLVIRHLPGA